jgi:hypothetical protein
MQAITLDIDKIIAPNWQAQEVQLKLNNLEQPNLSLYLTNFNLDAVRPTWHNISLNCPKLQVQPAQIACKSAKLGLQDEFSWLDFSYNKSLLNIDLHKFNLADGELSANLKFYPQNLNWQTNIIAKASSISEWLNYYKLYFDGETAYTINGLSDFNLTMNGSPELDKLHWLGSLYNLNLHNFDSSQVAENLSIELDTDIKFLPNSNIIGLKLSLQQGEIFFDPIYTNFAQPLQLQFQLRQQAEQYQLQQLIYQHDNIVNFTANAAFSWGEEFKIQRLNFVMPKTALNPFYETYLQSWLSAALQLDLLTKGYINANLDWEQDILLQIELDEVDLLAGNGSLAWQGLEGIIQWHNRLPNYATAVRWLKGQVSKFKFGSSQIYAEFLGSELKLHSPVRQPILDGALFVDKLNMHNIGRADMQLQFSGALRPISLGAITTAFGYPALDGQIAGLIPLASYDLSTRNFVIDGNLLIQAFDGEITVRNLNLQRAISNLPVLTADIDIEKLNLHTLSNITEFGAMQGELSGYIHDLKMLKWQPVAFNVYLATPADNKLPRRISQTAVQNLSNLGSGTMVGRLSQGLLGIFEQFNYEKIGWGCKLNAGVCIMTGVEPIKNGYYIVKGTGLPRIDVIGHNQQVDWRELFRRLDSISKLNAPQN